MTDSNTDAEIEDAKAYMQQMGRNTRLMLSAENGVLRDLPRTITSKFDGDGPAEALGKAYSMRDAIRDGGYKCECEYLGETEGFAWSDDTWHEVEFTIESKD